VKLLRLTIRGLWLITTLLFAAVDLLAVSLRYGWQTSSPARTRWLQRNSRRVIRVFVANLQAEGVRPAAGLLVSNHVSYLDILALGAASPAVFVAKSEVAGWPVFGWFARGCGTIFVRRAVRGDVTLIGAQIRTRLEQGYLVVLFPEGTSSDGQSVLPFKSSLLEPVREVAAPVYAAHLSYARGEQGGATLAPYWGDMTLLPHVLKLLGEPRIHVRVRVARMEQLPECRKELARQLFAEVSRLAPV
jgi:1-acyl-sn-glycerol-3-phosphate acyltransferase